MANVSKNTGFSMSRAVVTRGNAQGDSGETKARPTSEYDGLWINPTIVFEVEVDGEMVEETVRFPRGVAVSDLVDFKIYPNTDPQRAKRLRKVNAVMSAIRNKGLSLDEGESVRIRNVDLFLYRRQETQEHVVGTDELEELETALFGDD